MANINDEYKIPKLGQDNYYAWSVRAKAALIQKNCWEAVSPGYDDYDDLTDSQAKANQKALSFILLVVTDVYLDDIGHCKRASEAWSILEDIHSRFGLLHVIILLKEMVNVVKTKDISMQEYMSKIQNLNRKVATGGFNFDDRALALFFLLGLPLDTYEGLVRSLETDESNLTSKEVKAKLLLEEKRMQRVANTETLKETDHLLETKVLATKAKRQPWHKNMHQEQSKSSHSKPRFVICFACGKKGHIARHCDLKHTDDGDRDEKEGRKQTELATTKRRVLCSKQHPTPETNCWLLDSGATDHMTPHKEKLTNFRKEDTTVCTANGEKLEVAGKGTVTINLKDEYGGWTLTFTNVLYVPSLDDNLLSMSRIEEKGYKQIIEDGRVEIFDDTELIFTALRIGHLYCVEEKEDVKRAKIAVGQQQTTLWHRRLGHAHIRSLGDVGGLSEEPQVPEAPCSVRKEESDKSPPIEIVKEETCGVCIKGKMRRQNFSSTGSRLTTKPLELIHSDVVGKINPQSLGKANYFVTFIDDYTRNMYVCTISHKSDVLSAFDVYRRKVENKHDLRIKGLRSDNGGEYTSGAFKAYLSEHGIKHQLTAPYTPQQNGVAERANQTLLATTRCQLIEAGMPSHFWAESLNTACHVRNRCKSAALEGRIPHEMWTGRKDTLTYLRVFGCRAWAKVMQPGSKLAERAIECVHLGYQEGSKAYRLWDLDKRQVIVSRDVVFEEHTFPFRLTRVKELQTIDETPEARETASDDELLIYISEDEGEGSQDDEREDNHERREGDANLRHDNEDDSREQREETLIQAPTTANQMGENNNLQSLRRSKRNKKKVQRHCCKAETVHPDIPISVENALTGEEADEWRKAMRDEIATLKQNRTWQLVKRPKEHNVVKCKWVLRRKYDTFGKLQRYKARLVAQGFSQREGVDYDETYSPVVKLKTIRLLMALSVELGWKNEHVDITAAYLNSELRDVIYMEQPKYFEEQTTDKYVCLLLKSLYGLHQSGREWNECLDNYLKEEVGLTQSLNDPCVYYDTKGGLVVALYVDDLAIFGIRKKIDSFVSKLGERFQIKILGSLSSLLSLSIENPKSDCLLIHQKQYVKHILEVFKMENSRGAKTPLVVGEYLTAETPQGDTNEETIDESLYRRAIGSLLYLANGSRPDLAFATCYLSQFCNKATNSHWTAVKHTLRYLHQTEGRAIEYHRCEEPVRVYVDADWASDKNDRRSFSGFVIILAGGAIIWQTRKQRVIALSTVEAEYMAMAEATKEVIWLQGFLSEIKQEQFVQKPTTIFVDNQGAICLAKNRITSDKSKHIDVKYHFLREAVREGKVEFHYIPTQDNLADMFTKTPPPVKIERHCAALGFV